MFNLQSSLSAEPPKHATRAAPAPSAPSAPPLAAHPMAPQSANQPDGAGGADWPAASPGHWLLRVLDEIDYGMLLLTERGHVLHVNHAARAELDAAHPLMLQDGRLHARSGADAALLHEALHAAQRGLRRLLTLDTPQTPFTAAVVPLGPLGPRAPKVTLLLLGKRQVCERLSVQWFARSHALTSAETRVLEALCQGLEPREVAALHDVGLATVRSQIGAIRAKTGSASIRDLQRRVAVLPPMIGSLRQLA